MKKIHLLAMLLFTACVVPVSQAQESLFLKDYENSTRYNKPFSALISDVLENETYKSFADKTGLSENMLYRLKKQVDEKDPPPRGATGPAVCYSLAAQQHPHEVDSVFARHVLGDGHAAQVVEVHQVLAPLHVDHLQHELLFQTAGLVGADHLQTLGRAGEMQLFRDCNEIA